MNTIDPELLAAAKTAFDRAYAPYSNFQVGAALLGTDGKIYAGCNVENASYGLSRCAEQTAIQKMVSEGTRGFSKAVVYTLASPPSSPCGACRQILFEFGENAEVVMVNDKNETRVFTVSELLPAGFGPHDLE
jgi:cytidine deaminase